MNRYKIIVNELEKAKRLLAAEKLEKEEEAQFFDEKRKMNLKHLEEEPDVDEVKQRKLEEK